MSSFLTSPNHFRILGFSLVTENEPVYFKERGVITVFEDPEINRKKEDPILKKLRNLKKIVPNKPKYNGYKLPWNSNKNGMDLRIEFKEDVPDAILSIQLAIIQKRLYSNVRKVTHEQALVVSNIKKVNAVTQNSMKLSNQIKKDLFNKQERLVSSMSLLHQEIAKTKFYLGEVFDMLKKVKEEFDVLIGDSDDLSNEIDFDPNVYPNLYKLTYKQRSIRPRSYHQPFASEVIASDFRPRCSLDLPSDGYSWGFSRSREPSIRSYSPGSPYLRNNESSTSLNPDDLYATISNSSLVSGAISKVHFATSKAYRHNPQPSSEAMTPSHSGSSDVSIIAPLNHAPGMEAKKKAFSLRSTLSLANLKSFKKPNETSHKLFKEKGKPLNAKDRLSQIASSSPRQPNNGLSKWLPNVFRSHEPTKKSNLSTSIKFKHTDPPRIPKLEDIDYHIDMNTHIPGMEEMDQFLREKNLINNEIHNSVNISPRSLTRSFSSASIISRQKRRPSLRSLLLDHPSLSSPSPLQHESN